MDFSSDGPEVTVILPALNEEATIGLCLASIRRVFSSEKINGEIIVSDSSTDRTPEIAGEYGARVIHPREKGYGNAYLAAFREARGRFIIIGDADDTYDFSAIPRFLSRLRAGADLVIGSRFKGSIERGAMAPLHRYIGNPVLTWALNMTFRTSFSDAHSGFRGIRKEALDRLHLQAGGMEFASEMLVMAARDGLHIEEIPISYRARITPSKLHSFADGWRHLRFILLLNPVPFMAWPGFFVVAAGLALLIAVAIGGSIATASLHSFILSLMLISGGVQLVMTSMAVNLYSFIHGYEERNRFVDMVMNYHSLERFLLGGGVVIVIGLLLGARIVLAWVAAGFGELFEVVSAVMSVFLVIIGLQVIFSTIFISMMLLNCREDRHREVVP